VTVQDRTFEAAALVIATGGPSIPKMGATGYAYRSRPAVRPQGGGAAPRPRAADAGRRGCAVPRPFRRFGGCPRPHRKGLEFREAALFTHRGLSGPAILQVSSYWRHGEPVDIDFLPDEARDWLLAAKRTGPRQTLGSILKERLPDRLAATLADRIALRDILAGAADAKLREAQQRLANWRFWPNGTEGLAKAEVTAGGISTAELSSKTMEAKRVQGLYVVGEAVDVTGWLGGYNFQWAWASGWAAAQSI
jgi:predicted Rossmann fold flavoprotein